LPLASTFAAALVGLFGGGCGGSGGAPSAAEDPRGPADRVAADDAVAHDDAKTADVRRSAGGFDPPSARAMGDVVPEADAGAGVRGGRDVAEQTPPRAVGGDEPVSLECPPGRPFVCATAEGRGPECREAPCVPDCSRIGCLAGETCQACASAFRCLPEGVACEERP
jgi:hypothetical protein